MSGLFEHGDIYSPIPARKAIDILAGLCDTMWASVAEAKVLKFPNVKLMEIKGWDRCVLSGKGGQKVLISVQCYEKIKRVIIFFDLS